ncbi:MAG: PKD domain-containing protein [Saprospiraceae bacterium]|nr:PKD domain-containing protein [Saprospiraceae bacterium]MCF8250732.1 PKD domain-containing protein [Saprospiraceae bacterium]MCF8279789.1 PKD domain-containing protein [Bacteroidales bacterium]MCF8310506.1 PKD domain-containing protein [Saprospiraceae bacterium]MCF8440862.1 PKD domain-containing protein [Saprospiraceae bacterium]
MKKRLQLFFTLISICFFIQNALAQQGGNIIGPQTLCVGACDTYEVVLFSPNEFIEVVTWGANTGTTVGTGNPISFCPQVTAPGTVVLTAVVIAFGPNGNTITYDMQLPIVITYGLTPVIVPTIASCPQDSSNQSPCEKICAFGTAQYEVTGIPPTTPVTWSVQGAQSFTPNGHIVTVEWGAPGQGQVSVVAGGNPGSNGPFQFFCGQQSISAAPNSTSEIYFSEADGTAPYTVTYTWNGVAQAPFTLQSMPTVMPFASPGTYVFTVTDATGQTDNCTTTVTNSAQDCWVSAYPSNIDHQTDFLACNGAIQLVGVGGFPPYTFQWSNGNTTQNLNDVCCGTYSVTVSDASGCFSSTSIIVACPDSTSTCAGETSLCVEILEEPEANIGSLPPPQPNGTIAICQGQTIYFQNNSLNATSYVWDFGNFNTSTQFEPSQTYDVPGSYIVSLIARNECYCADTSFVEVYVIAADVPEINCTGTICEGETVTYSTDTNCGTYTWALTGSYNILDGGMPTDNFITVEWLAGPQGTISLSVAGCAGTVCTLPNVVPIPIISDNVQIQGPDKVCEGSTEEYYIPDYQGTSINWTVLGSGNITDGQGTERITVNWFGNANQGNPQRVIVEFENCYLGCSGKDTLDVNIVPGFYATGPIEVCASSSGTYQSRNTVTNALIPANWQVINSLGAVVWSSPAATNTANIPFNFPAGAYTVRATAANASSYCNNGYNIYIKLVAPPPAPTAITGEDEICPGLTYSYEGVGLATTDFTWTFTGGAPANFGGNPANVTWNAAGPYAISVVQTATTGLACTSLPASLTVNPIPAFSVTGDSQVCREQSGTYSVPFFENIDYQWVISPAAAGTVVSGANTEQVEVLWHTDGPATVGVTVCGATENYNVTVLPLPEPVAQTPANLCQGETAVIQTTVGYASYVWNNASGAQISTLTTPSLGAGNYEVEVTDANGCVGDTIFEIIELAGPNISISTPAYYALCSGGPAAVLHATESSPAYSYQWQRNGVNVGTNSPLYSTNQPGDYQVIATNVAGCTAISNLLVLVDCAAIGGTCVGGQCFGGAGGGPPVPGCTPAGTVDFSMGTSPDCNAPSFTNLSTNFVPGSFTWYFGDGTTSTLDNPPPHTYPNVGYYTVVLIGEVNGVTPGTSCAVGTYHDVLIPVEADFAYSSACPGAPVQFTDLSVFLSPYDIIAWSWDFGDPSSGGANTSASQNPMHTFASPGTYNVELTISSSAFGGCTVTFVKPVTVFMPPAVSFALPSATCENTSLPFDAVVGSGVASVYWDFGDPTSGDGNTSEQFNSFHEFDAPGNYTIQLTALSIEGCLNTFTDNMTITPNTLSGNITMAPPSPLCEGETTTLTSPAGGVSWIWSNSDILDNITVSESGVYTVTLTDATGCTYAPPPASVVVFGEPNGIIKAVEYNEFGQPVAFYENNHSVCEGEDVFLIIQGSSNNSYQWSNGSTDDQLEFSEDKGNLLPVGDHDFTVTVTDMTTGCTATEGPFTVTVNPVPTVAITSSPSGFICENTSATLSVTSPNATYNYQWNTGETGNSITVVAGGTYFATAINQFGCKSQSNEVDIHNAPDIDLVPSGCHSRCEPDTMCLPLIPDIASYQWLWNGSPMAAPNGTMANPIFDQSGEYAVVLTDIYGCTSTSEVLTLDLFAGFGDITGDVYFDVNGNGVIDAGDTLVSGINIFLNNGTMNVDTVTSSLATGYNFVNILAANYGLILDTLNLPADWEAVLVSTTVTLSGCDVEEQFDWLLFSSCPTSTASVQLFACPGGVADYNGNFIAEGTSQDFTLVNYLGCDSIVTVFVNPLTTSTGAEAFDACPGTSINYNGTDVAAGTSMDFTLVNYLGCDSIVTVTVNPLPAPTSSVALTACTGSFAEYNGTPLQPGADTLFLFPSVLGCDSVVNVTVTELTASTGSESLSACPGTSANYNGTDILAGASQDFTLMNWLGCDSVVTVTVTPLPTSTLIVDGVACSGTFFDYNGTPVAAGTTETFYEVNASGCTDTVVVAVVEIPTSTSAAQLTACPGTTVTYGGVTLSPGDVQPFTLMNQFGCDSVVTVTVLALQSDTTQLAFEVCEGETTSYNGQTLAAGDQFTWVGTNQAGCDSVVYVSVTGLPPVSFALSASQICWNAVDGSISVGNISGSTGPYQYSLNGTAFQADTLFAGLPPGDYTVSVQDQNGCVFNENITMPVISPMVTEAQDETLVCGETVKLRPLVLSDLPVIWEWSDSTGVISTAAELQVSSPGIYVFNVTNDCETSSGNINVAVEPLKQAKLIYLPNSFSPNDDGINDCYQGYVDPGTELLSYELKIFDRWGDLLFRTEEIDGCWDGLFQGKKLNPSVMVYLVQMQVRNCDGVVVDLKRKGDIHLVR